MSTFFFTLFSIKAHHATAASYRRILEHFKADTKESKIFVWGCSATLCRYDGVALSSVFDEITFHRDFLDMIKAKWLCSFRVTTVKTEHEMPSIKSANNDFDVSSLAQALDTPTRNQLVVQIHASHASESDCQRRIFECYFLRYKCDQYSVFFSSLPSSALPHFTQNTQRIVNQLLSLQ